MRFLVRSPVLHTVGIFCFVVLVLTYCLPRDMIGLILDAFIVSGAVAFYLRFFRSIWIAIHTANPDAASVYVSGVSLMVLSSGFVRTAHWLQLFEEDLVPRRFPSNGSLVMSSLLVVSIYLLILAPPLHDGKLQMTPYAALAILFSLGPLIAGVLFFMQWYGM